MRGMRTENKIPSEINRRPRRRKKMNRAITVRTLIADHVVVGIMELVPMDEIIHPTNHDDREKPIKPRKKSPHFRRVVT